MTGLAITTFNREDHFKTLYNSIPFHKVDVVVVVNGGEKYKEEYPNVHWIQHDDIKFPSVARNDGMRFLIEKGCDNIFVSEDDMIIKSENIFDEYINASKVTGLEYFCFASYAWEAGPVGNRTPKLKAQYSPELTVSFFKNTCNEFTFRTKNLLEKAGYYEETMKNCFDIEWIYRASKFTDICAPFWYFADIAHSDDLVMNNPDATSTLDGDGQRVTRLAPDFNIFLQKNGCHIYEIPYTSSEEVINQLKKIKSK